MTTEDIVEKFITEGIKAYKKSSAGSLEARKLDRHEGIQIDGITFSFWREWVVYKLAEYIGETFPDISVECNLDGNESFLQLEMTEEDQRELNGKLYVFLRKIGV